MIGIFDSGSGGLTVLSAIRERLPSADVLYFGDIKHAPYGSRGREDLSMLTLEAMKFLHERGANSIVSACNSVSASIAVSLFDALSIEPKHLIEMVGPTVSMFKDSPARVLLTATPATITSQIYQGAFRMIGKDIGTLAIERLAGAIETGAPEGDIEAIIREAFTGTDLSRYDCVVLACTHYPLARGAFREVLGKGMAIVDPADAVAARVESRFWPREAGGGATQFAITKDSDVFRALVAKLFPDAGYSVEVLG
jgi:glutamate racemase